ncbi:Josephin-domain-containing protein [Dissophora ornata]|nr:Ataxin-3 [Dissophora ornata]KAI8598525.1 Josephin-domain-containing protein [Dissophora ornata]
MDLVPYIFHERQEGNLCAQHCLNALLQGPYFTAIDLAELARQLDQKEQDALGNTGVGLRDVTSQNMDDSGFFSVQVLSHALSIWNIQIIPWGAKEVSDAKAEPEREAGFICNLDQHWYTLRRFGPSTQRWYDLNSMLTRPTHMSATYLGMTLSQLEAEGYSIFVVRPLNKIETEPATTETNTEIKPVPMPEETPAAETTTTTTVATSSAPTPTGASGFLTERQEMERIRRQRIEERERAAQQKANPSLDLSSSSSAVDDSNNNNKRTRADQTEEESEKKDGRRTPVSKSVLVTTPSFLPRCEVDDMAATMPLTENAPASGAQQPTFGGAGYRLGGPPPTAAAADNSSLPPGFSIEDTGFEETGGDEDAEWEMMQQAIAMSLQTNK